MKKLKYLNETILIIISLVCLILSVIFGVLKFLNEFELISILFGVLTLSCIYVGGRLFYYGLIKLLDNINDEFEDFNNPTNSYS